MTVLRDCECCEQGKHQTCLIEVFDDETDDWIGCPCEMRGHVEFGQAARWDGDLDEWKDSWRKANPDFPWTDHPGATSGGAEKS